VLVSWRVRVLVLVGLWGSVDEAVVVVVEGVVEEEEEEEWVCVLVRVFVGSLL